MRALLDNPLLIWGLGQARREKRVMIGVAVFLLLFYGMVMLSVLAWSNSFTPDLDDLLTTLHFEAWGACAIMLLLWAPARMAQTIAKEKEQGTLDMLRLTGLSGDELAVGYAATSVSLPLMLCALTAPMILLGVGGHGGFGAVIRGYTCLLVLTPFYVLAGGLAGLAVKKAQHAGSAAIFFCLACFGASGAALSDWETAPLAIFGPWGGGLASTINKSDFYVIPFLNRDVPGDLVQVVFMVLFARALLAGLGRRFAGEPAVVLGRTGALTVLIGVAALSALTFYPTSAGPNWRMSLTINKAIPGRPVLAAHVIVVFMAALLYAVEVPIRWRDLVRGRSRRGSYNDLLPEERFDLRRFGPGLGTLVLFALLLLVGLVAQPASSIPPVAVLLAVSVLLLAAAVATLSVQVALLMARDVGAPRLLAGLALVVLWIGPLIASYILAEIGAPAGFYQLPRAANPWYGITMACYAGDASMAQKGLAPVALAMTCGAVHLFLAFALASILRTHVERAVDHANSLVALPADAYAAPGSLTQRCGQGHMYSEAWDSCPHCPAQAAPTPGGPRPEPERGAP